MFRAAWAHRADTQRRLARATLPSLFGLAPCGVYPASVVTAGAVRSYRTFSPLPTGHPGICPSGQISVPKHEQPAVCSLWH